MKKIKINDKWSFKLNEGESEQISLPHDFSITVPRKADAVSGASGGYFQGGIGEYERELTAKKNKRYFLIFDGIFGLADIFVNYNLAYTNKYAYNSFYVDITDFLRYDKSNIITVRVNNQNQPNARWYTGSGIYRDVFVCECGENYIHPFGAFMQTQCITEQNAQMQAEVTFFSKEKGEGVLEFDVYKDGQTKELLHITKYIFAEAGENSESVKLQIENPKIWDIDSPEMYTLKTTLKIGNSVDTDKVNFGIRTVYTDSKRGLLLNGKSVKLRGGCVHHDHGPLGAKSYREAEYRRIALLKKAGFNAVRCSHNPQSQYFYEACDRLGMLVMDELFDYWTDGKQPNDFHSYFHDNYETWIDQIIRRNRCHPSIIMWSTGNEIYQKSGRSYGYRYARNIANGIRKLDTSRPLTHALCGLWDNAEENRLANETSDYGSEKMDYWAEKTRITADTVDIIGYNYMEFRIERDLVRFPGRLIINTESFPTCAYTTIHQLLDNPRIVGDFVWTAWDYFGETGIGHITYSEEGDGFRLLDHPYHIANCGDIDICGVRKPQSYYREIAWGLRKDPYIAPRTPKNAGVTHSPSAWGFYECEHSWNWEGYEGKPIEVYVFGECDEMILEVNGKEVGRQNKTANGVYVFSTVYRSGTVCARAIKNGCEIGKSTLSTEKEPSKISLKAENSYFAKKREESELIFVNVEIQDENGMLCTQDDRLVTYEAQGADIIAVGSGSLTDEELYVSNKRCVNKGRGLVVLKKREKEVKLIAKANGLKTEEITLQR